MLAHSLHQTGAFGFPLEYANPAYWKEWMRILGTSGFEETFREIVRRRTAPTGIFGIKVHYWQLRSFGGFFAMQRFLPNPRYVLLTRRNIVKQAVSWSIASQTGVWIQGQEPIARVPRYDFEDIDWRLRRTLVYSAQWRYTLAANGCRYLEFVFEDMVDDIGSVVAKIANFMNVSLDEPRIPHRATTKKQATTINVEWEKRFLQEHDDRGLLTGRMADIVPRANDGRKPKIITSLQRLVGSNLFRGRG
jgi:LPS sulfotransferase NodH